MPTIIGDAGYEIDTIRESLRQEYKATSVDIDFYDDHNDRISLEFSGFTDFQSAIDKVLPIYEELDERFDDVEVTFRSYSFDHPQQEVDERPSATIEVKF